MIKERLLGLQKSIKNHGSLYLICNNFKTFFTSFDQKTIYDGTLVNFVSLHPRINFFRSAVPENSALKIKSSCLVANVL